MAKPRLTTEQFRKVHPLVVEYFVNTFDIPNDPSPTALGSNMAEALAEELIRRVFDVPESRRSTRKAA